MFSSPDTGQISVWRPRAEHDLSALPRERVRIIQGFKPEHDFWLGRGFKAAPERMEKGQASVIFLPRAKAHALALIAAAAQDSGPIFVDGQKTDGIDSVLKACRKRATISDVISKSHGKGFVIQNHDGLADWLDEPAPGPEGFFTSAGVFSADRIDHGSRLLAQVLPNTLGGRVADLGAGWGYLSAEILSRPDVTELHLVEAEFAALCCAKLNINDPRAQFHWADATKFEQTPTVDTIVMNPPFHTGRAAEPELGRAFLTAAARLLKPKGELWLVANRHLPYEAALAELFTRTEEVGGDGGFKLLKASHPRRRTRA